MATMIMRSYLISEHHASGLILIKMDIGNQLNLPQKIVEVNSTDDALQVIATFCNLECKPTGKPLQINARIIAGRRPRGFSEKVGKNQWTVNLDTLPVIPSRLNNI